jgi:hypothetical protein
VNKYADKVLLKTSAENKRKKIMMVIYWRFFSVMRRGDWGGKCEKIPLRINIHIDIMDVHYVDN